MSSLSQFLVLESEKVRQREGKEGEGGEKEGRGKKGRKKERRKVNSIETNTEVGLKRSLGVNRDAEAHQHHQTDTRSTPRFFFFSFLNGDDKRTSQARDARCLNIYLESVSRVSVNSRYHLFFTALSPFPPSGFFTHLLKLV